MVGIHTVFIAKENILFLKEWILYHKYMGIDHFFLYDNSGSYGYDKGLSRPLFERNRKNKYGISYDDIVSLPDAEIADVLDHIRREVPNVHIVPWQPTDAEGHVRFAQVQAQNDALERFGPTVDWMVFMDIDEFLVSDRPVPAVAQKLEAAGYDGGMMYDRTMTSRFDHVDRYVTETTMTFRDPFRSAPKYLCKVSRTWYVIVHRFVSLGRRYEFSERELFFLHYKLPSSHPDQRDHFEERDNGIPPEWLDATCGRRAARTAALRGSSAPRTPNGSASWSATNGDLQQMGDRLRHRHTRGHAVTLQKICATHPEHPPSPPAFPRTQTFEQPSFPRRACPREVGGGNPGPWGAGWSSAAALRGAYRGARAGPQQS